MTINVIIEKKTIEEEINTVKGRRADLITSLVSESIFTIIDISGLARGSIPPDACRDVIGD